MSDGRRQPLQDWSQGALGAAAARPESHMAQGGQAGSGSGGAHLVLWAHLNHWRHNGVALPPRAHRRHPAEGPVTAGRVRQCGAARSIAAHLLSLCVHWPQAGRIPRPGIMASPLVTCSLLLLACPCNPSAHDMVVCPETHRTDLLLLLLLAPVLLRCRAALLP